MKNKILVTLVLSIFLAACQDSSNPLSKKPADEAARLLVLASEKASLQIGLSPQESGDNYRKCMQQNAHGKTCQSLIKAMSKALGKQGIAVTPAQVADAGLYKSIAPNLMRLSYFME